MWDVMDGHFVRNITIGPAHPEAMDRSRARAVLRHALDDCRTDGVRRVFRRGGGQSDYDPHRDHGPAQARPCAPSRAMGARVGITFRPRTPVKEILGVIEEVDMVLVMTVEPGFGGQPMIPKTLNKVRELDLLRRKEGLGFRLEVDGGITPSTAPLALAAGADVLVAGDAIFGNGDMLGNLKALRQAVGAAK